ncbi:MAG TPA: hypothetical protein VET83_03640 [Candidatus Dormibacteraeota bacterium]|nr:hypothetical protein [Candidatus Dormibacteraeota bacterium]
MSRARSLWILAAALAGTISSGASARPVDVIHPGGMPEEADTLVLEYPVLRSPSLLSLRASSPWSIAAASEVPAPPDSASLAAAALIRNQDPANSAPRAPSAAAQDAGLGTSSTASLLFSGSKSLSVEMGHGRDASLHQTLDLTVRGRVAGDVELQATLSDQQLPFEPDGTTRELQDLDRLFLAIKAPQGEVTMGDFRLESGPGEFARITRQLQGVRGQAKVLNSTWDVAAASAKGERGSLEIKGEEGKQGPYELVRRVQGEIPPGVVAGSETVWLDGAKLKRGADQDYVIDYGAGTVTFTTRHPITSQSRLAFDFEQATTSYRRSLYAAFTQGALGSSGRWYATYLRNGDDPKSPIGAALTPEESKALGSLGDSAATSSGARFVGAGKGEYSWDQSDPTNPHWIHLGQGRGDYLVEFVSVGAGRGAYADTLSTDGGHFYQFRGQSLGSYTPGRSLPSPDDRRLVDVGGSARLFQAIRVEAEGARSGLDRNALSSLDDGDNVGNAMRLAASLDPRSLSIGGRGLGSLRASGTFRSRDSRFSTMDRLDPVFENERWNQAQASGGGEQRGEFALQYDPVSSFSLRGEMGKRDLTGGSSSIRKALAADLRGAVAGAVHWENSRNSLGLDSGSRDRFDLDLARTRGFVTPRVRLLDERIVRQEGDSIPERRSREWNLGMGLAPARQVALRASYGERQDRRADAALDWTTTRAATWEAGLSARSRASLSLEMGWSRRRVSDPGGIQASDLAQMALLAGAPGSAFTSELRYDATQLREAQVLRRVVPVDAGTGSYDAFGNPSFRGDYQVVTETGAPAPRTRANVQLRLDAFPGRSSAAAASPSFWRAWGGTTFLRLETYSTLPLGDPRHALDPRDYLDASATIRGNVSARQSVEYAPRGARYDMRAEGGFRRDRTGEFENLRVVRDAHDATLRLRNPLWGGTRLTTSATVDGSTEDDRRTDTGARYGTRIRGRGLDLELSRPLNSSWSVSLIGRGRQDHDQSRGGRQQVLAAGPSARCASGGKLRVDGRALWARTSQQGVYQPGHYFVPPFLGNHLDYDLLGDYRLRDQVSVSLSWNGQLAAGRTGVYTGRFELRSYF